MIEAMASLPPQAPTSASAATVASVKAFQESSTTTSSDTKDLVSISSCTTASDSPDAAMKTAQHSPLSFSTPDSNQRKMISGVHPRTDSHSGVDSRNVTNNGHVKKAKNVTPSSVVTVNISGDHGASRKVNEANGVNSCVISSSPATSSSSGSVPNSASVSGEQSFSASIKEESRRTNNTALTSLSAQYMARQDTANKSMTVTSQNSTAGGSTNSSFRQQTSRQSSSGPLTSKIRPVLRNISTESSMSAPRLHPAIVANKSKVKKVPKHEPRSTTPVPPPGARSQSQNFKMKTPVRSPKNGASGTFQGFNSSDMPSFGSPSIFLSPCLLSPPGAKENKANTNQAKACGQEVKIPVGGITPTNFSSDFGKNDINDDALNNVLPWDLSPNAYGLFSPEGGLTASITPSALSKPVMGIGDTSKFALPFDQDKRDAASGGIMMCVSPLARKKGSAVTQKRGQTPINFNDVFASPKTDERNRLQTVVSNEIPTIADLKNEESKLELETSLAERDVMEHQDLNTLLKLAETTPRRNTDGKDSAGTRVFRGAGGAFAYPAAQPLGPPSFLHIPMIGKNTGGQTKRSDTRAKSTVSSSKKGANESKNKKSSKSKESSQDGILSNPSQPEGSMGSHHPPPPGYYPPPHYMHPAAGAGMAQYTYPYQNQTHPSYLYSNAPVSSGPETVKGIKKKLGVVKINKPSKSTGSSSGTKRPIATTNTSNKKSKKSASRGRGPGKKKTTAGSGAVDKQKAAATISAINSASGKKNDKAASLASAVLRGVTMRPSGKWQAQLYFAGKSRYIGVFDSREKAALAYEIAREHLQNKSVSSGKDTDAHVNAARKAAFEGVNETDPRLANG